MQPRIGDRGASVDALVGLDPALHQIEQRAAELALRRGSPTIFEPAITLGVGKAGGRGCLVVGVVRRSQVVQQRLPAACWNRFICTGSMR